MFMRDVFMK